MNNSAPIGQGASDHVETFRSLIRCFGLVRRVMAPYFRQFGLNGAQWGALRTLHAAEAEGAPGLRPSELGKRLIVRPASVSNLLTHLKHRELVSVTESPDDRRAKRVRLTEGGRAVVERVRNGHSEHIERLVSCFDAEERGELKRLLDRLNEHLETRTRKK